MLYPKIGIRPVIDGRWGGVRESLENQTMRMAENAAKLISESLKYPDGTPVQCVIGCTTIGGGAEAARVAEQFSTQNVTATLSVTPCWCYGTETFDMDPNTIKAVWGFNGTERPGAVYLAALGGAGALMAKSVQTLEVIAWPDLGCEAVRRLTVKDMPLTVILDAHGGDLYQSGPAAYLEAK